MFLFCCKNQFVSQLILSEFVDFPFNVIIFDQYDERKPCLSGEVFTYVPKKKKCRSVVFTDPRIPQSGIPSFLESHLDILDRLLGISQECEDVEDVEDVEDIEDVEDVEVSAAEAA